MNVTIYYNNSVRQMQNRSTSMATVTDSARIASMAKRRKTKGKFGKGIEENLKRNIFNYSVSVFASKNEIDLELSPTTKEFVATVHNAFVMHLKVLSLIFFLSLHYKAEIIRLCL